MTMTTDVSGGPGAFRRLMNKVVRWSEAMDYSGFDYTLDRIASVEGISSNQGSDASTRSVTA
jgi:hypothetical protein